MVSVLVVDDERDIREAVAEVLKDEGYEVIDARDGAEALDKIRQEKVDLILLRKANVMIVPFDAVLGELAKAQ